MATGRMDHVIEHLRRAALAPDGAGLSDAQLLSRFVERRDEAAFEVLVRRHGPMVWGVCRRVLGHHDAEDAFQAAFLVLARKAASVAPRERLANWLYGVAYQTAHRARVADAKRRVRERVVATMPEPEAPARERDPCLDWQPLLDRELSGLPDKYRVAIVLCDLEGKTRKDAARELGWKEGTLSGRLARARALLARRLTRHGLALSGAGVAGLLVTGAADAGVPSGVVASTVRAAGLLAAGSSSAGLVPARVTALTEGVLKAMLLSKLKVQAGLVLAAFACIAVTVLAQPRLVPIRADSAAPNQAPLPEQGVKPDAPNGRIRVKNAWLTGVDAEARTITAVLGTKPFVMEEREAKIKDGQIIPGKKLREMAGVQGRLHNAPQLVNTPVAKDAQIRVGDKKARLADLPVNRHVVLELALADDVLVVKAIVAEGTRGASPTGGKGTVNARQARVLRWTMKFNTSDGNDYLAQLMDLGAILAFQDREGRWLVIRTLTPPVKPKPEDLRTMDRIFWIDSDKKSVAGLSRALGLPRAPNHIVTLFPHSLEKDLLEKELAYRHRQEQDIKETVFEILRRDGKYTPRVIHQTVK